ncbi:MAG: hypothetical protein ACE5OR_09720 [bacterium]
MNLSFQIMPKEAPLNTLDHPVKPDDDTGDRTAERNGHSPVYDNTESLPA